LVKQNRFQTETLPVDEVTLSLVRRGGMRIAILADVHGNCLALDAVLADLTQRGGAELVVNLGDCVSGPLWPAETMERLATLDVVTVRGIRPLRLRRARPGSARVAGGASDDSISDAERPRLPRDAHARRNLPDRGGSGRTLGARRCRWHRASFGRGRLRPGRAVRA
jgi:hypothetical protein